MSEAEFVTVARLAELRENEPVGVEVGGRLIVLVRQGERVYALGGHCPHTGMRLADGIVEQDRLICFYHGANYDLATGCNIPLSRRGRRFETRDLPCYAVRIEDGLVRVQAADADDVPS